MYILRSILKVIGLETADQKRRISADMVMWLTVDVLQVGWLIIHCEIRETWNETVKSHLKKIRVVCNLVGAAGVLVTGHRRTLTTKTEIQHGRVEDDFSLPETNIAPENSPHQKESSFPTTIFQGIC